MTVKRKDTEIFDQAHQMYAEGTSDVEPTSNDIEKLMCDNGFESQNIEIWFDNMQGFYRWYCDIQNLVE